MINIDTRKTNARNEIDVFALYFGDNYDYNETYYFQDLQGIKDFLLKSVKGLSKDDKIRIKQANEDFDEIKALLDSISEFELDKLILYKTKLKFY